MFFIAGVDMFDVFRVVSRLVSDSKVIRFWNAATGDEIGAMAYAAKGLEARVDYITNWSHRIDGLKMATVNECLQSFPKGMQVKVTINR